MNYHFKFISRHLLKNRLILTGSLIGVKYSKLFFAIIFLSIFSSCNNDSEQQRESLVPQEEGRVGIENFVINRVDNYSFSELFEGFEVIPIGGDLIGQIDKIIAKDDKIVIMTKSGKDRVFLLDLSTGENKAIVTRGIGPEEMTAVNNIRIFNDRLFVYDVIRTKMKVLDLNGNDLNEFYLDESFDDFVYLSDSTIVGQKTIKYEQYKDEFKVNVFNVKDQSNLSLTLNAFKLSMHDFERNINQSQSLVAMGDGSARYVSAFSDTVYAVTSDRVEPTFVFDFDNRSISYKDICDENLKMSPFFKKNARG